MEKRTCISLNKSTYLELARRKTHPNQSFDELIRLLLGLPIGDQRATAGPQEGGGDQSKTSSSPAPSPPVDASFLVV